MKKIFLPFQIVKFMVELQSLLECEKSSREISNCNERFRGGRAVEIRGKEKEKESWSERD